jgi:hypothetical protein
MKTKLAKGTTWPGKKPRVKTPVNLDAVQKCSDPYKPERVILQHKYDELFKDVKEGDCFRCPDELTTAAISRALRMHIKRQGWDGVVRQQARTEDGVARVWAVKIIKPKNNSQAC